MRPGVRTAAILVVAAVSAAGCQVQRRAASVGAGVLEVKEVSRATDRPALSPVAWSADGQRFAYGTRGGLWVHGLGDRTGARVAEGQVVTAVAWSSSADTIAYVDAGAAWTVRPDGRHRRKIALPGFVTSIAWAPGGDRLAAVVRSATDGPDGLWWTSPDGTIVRKIQWEPRGRRVVVLGWFPDTLHLFVGIAAHDEDATTEWWSIRIAYPDFIRLTGPARPALDPVLAPSGQWMALIGDDGGKQRAYVVRTDGTGMHALSPAQGRIAGLAWSHGSDKIAYAVITGDAQADVHVVGVTGSAGQLVATYRP